MSPGRSRRPGRRLPRLLAATTLVIVPALTGCGDDSGGRITVLAASSLTGVLDEVAAQFEARYDGVRVRLSFAASPTVVSQVIADAPADVVATASMATMESAVRAGAVERPQVFARNAIALAVPRGNPGKVDAVADLGDDRLRVAVCAPTVPCGVTARAAYTAAGVKVRPDTLAPDVRAVVTLLATGEVDAGFVYRTDVRASRGALVEVPLPAGVAATTDYPVAVVRASDERALAARFMAYLLDDARPLLEQAGFETP